MWFATCRPLDMLTFSVVQRPRRIKSVREKERYGLWRGIMEKDYGEGLWRWIMERDYGEGLWRGIEKYTHINTVSHNPA